MNPRLPVFLSYAHEDKPYLEEFVTHLKPLQMQDMVCAWSDLDLAPGAEWAKDIGISIDNARAAVLFVSQHFLASDFVRKSELPRLLNKRKSKGLPILPLMVGHCVFELATFKYPDPDVGPDEFVLSSIQTVNKPDKPLSSLQPSQRNEVFARLAQQLHKIWKGEAG
ncbi:MAG TPA: toll/interleukin-1 receptor domain-containing protein [Nitrospiraceae bacterium]|nr:toll/interleukin-1 receptor domain-containing protein [Nitrospiraceae bacterium]